MNSSTGDVYPSFDDAVKAGAAPRDIVEVRGSAHAVGRLRMAAKNEAKRREKRRRMQKASRAANRGLVLAVFLLTGPAYAQVDEPGFGVTAVLSAQSVMGAGAESKVRPSATLEVEGPVAFKAATPLRAFVRLRLLGMPGEAFDLTAIETVRAVEASLGSSKRIGRVQLGGQELWTSVIGEWGFSTALPRGPNIAQGTRNLRHFGGGFQLEERSSGAWVSMIYGRAEAVGDRGWGQWMLAGAVPIKVKERGVLVIGGDAALGVGNPCAGAAFCRQQDFVSIEVGVSLPDLIAVMR